jgi:hypothetical protein
MFRFCYNKSGNFAVLLFFYKINLLWHNKVNISEFFVPNYFFNTGNKYKL